MTSRDVRRLAAIVAAAALVGPATARAWVAVRVAPRVGAVAVGVAAGAVAGAAVASSYYPPPPQTVVVTPPPAPPPAAAPAPAPAPAAAAGTIVTTLPAGCVESGGRYQCGSVWYQPYFGANGVYYQVVR
jgi:hypothetical protein